MLPYILLLCPYNDEDDDDDDDDDGVNNVLVIELAEVEIAGGILK